MSYHSDINQALYNLIFVVERWKWYDINSKKQSLMIEIYQNYQWVFTHYQCEMKMRDQNTKLIITDSVI
jgi:hypothetical protein